MAIWPIVYISFIFLLSVLAIYTSRWIQERKRLRKLIYKIPGPPGTPVLGNIKDLLCSPEKLWLTLRKFAKEYHPIYKVWVGYEPGVFLTSPEDIEVLISSTKHMEKSSMYGCLHMWLGTGLLTSTGSKWHVRRKLLTPAFHFSILKQFLTVFSEQSDILVDELRSECNKAHTNFVPHISKFTLNSICETAMGIAPDLIQSSEDSYRTSIYKIGYLTVQRIIRPWLHNSVLYCFTPAFWQQWKLAKSLHSISFNVIKERKINTERTNLPISNTQEQTGFLKKKRRLAMLDLLILAQKSDLCIDDEGIREEVDTFMFEGHDTTSVAICYTLMLLACNQDVQEKVVSEIWEVFKKSNEEYSYENLQELKYLEMVIKESLRLYPSVPLIARQTSETLHLYSGYVVPSNVTVTVLIYDIHRNPLYYPNPEKFDPDRFLPENCKNRHPFAYIPFSAGPRNCIGQRFAMLELKMVIAKIVQHFKLITVDTPESLTLKADLLIRTVDGVRIKLEHRS